MPQFPTCHPFFTRFQCCSEGEARESTRCSGCPNKVDTRNERICCSDCSQPIITDAKGMMGYCRTDAPLSIQRKPRSCSNASLVIGRVAPANARRLHFTNKGSEVSPLLGDCSRNGVVVNNDRCLASQKGHK